MHLSRLAVIAASCGFALAACGPALPPAGNYATVSGRVTDATSGAGVAGAIVTVNVVLAATSDASGNFRIANVPTGDWDYAVQPPNGYLNPASVVPAPLAPGESRTLAIVLTHR